MNILVIGNGFDLAHGLPTTYKDFLEFAEDYQKLNKRKQQDSMFFTPELECEFLGYLVEWLNQDKNDKNAYNLLKEIDEFLKDNIWLQFFNVTQMNIGWIDFEGEISRVIQSIDSDMKKDNSIESTIVRNISEFFLAAYFLYDLKILEKERDAEVFKLCKYMPVGKHSEFLEEYRRKHPIESLKEEITYKDLIARLERDLEKLIRLLEIYLAGFLGKVEITKISKDIKDFNIDHVLSFNYTTTFEKLYGQERDIEYDYIHGKADINNTIVTNNMVLGIDEYLPKKEK